MVNGNHGKIVTIALLIALVVVVTAQPLFRLLGVTAADLSSLKDLGNTLALLLAGIVGINVISPKGPSNGT